MKKTKIVVVEDEPEVRQTLVDILEVKKYKVDTASNGQEGINVIKRVLPDLVICDVMMPIKDGFELVKEIKMDEKTELIPVLFLTANVSTTAKLKGLEFGADDYITKPFLMEELLLKVHNAIHMRKRLLQVMYSTPEKVVTESADERFLKKLKLTIENKISDPNLGMPDVAEGLNISTSSLQKRLKALTQKSVSQFIREYRLKRSLDLIYVGYGNLSQISEKVGFRSLSYFTKSFKDFYGHPPSQVES
ncbi:MAG: response regulator [Bacteroidia bacterium]|nr:response regulator [Bacteroidia bacterium]